MGNIWGKIRGKPSTPSPIPFPEVNFDDLKEIVKYAEKEGNDLTKSDQHPFPFENIVLEGGGVKGLAYCGAIRVSSVKEQALCAIIRVVC